MVSEVMTIEKLKESIELVNNCAPKTRWSGRIFENSNMTIGKSRPKTLKERWFSWPWRPWVKLVVWQEPDPNCYEMPYPPMFSVSGGFENPKETSLFAHPVTAAKIRAAIAPEGNDDE